MESHTTYTTTETHGESKPVAGPVTLALATVGFIALVVLGLLLAIYSARFVPGIMNKMFVALESNPNDAHLGVVSTTTIPFGDEQTAHTTLVIGTSTTTATSTPATVITAPTKPSGTATPAKPRFYGLPNLKVTVLATGYLANGTNESFVPSGFVPAGARGAVQFSIANTGTNVSAPWMFAAVLPTHNGYAFTSPIEQALNPGDHIVFTLAFDQADWGANRPLNIIVDPIHQITESNEVDNSATAYISVH